jgi:CheY-like chemotaxis protein
MILVVDDDEDVRATICQALDTLAYDWRDAEDGPTALAMLDECKPNVVILDYSMPGMNGDQVAARIHETRADLPVIFASGYSDEAELRRIIGGDAPILHKPFRIGELAELIDGALKRAAV